MATKNEISRTRARNWHWRRTWWAQCILQHEGDFCRICSGTMRVPVPMTEFYEHLAIPTHQPLKTPTLKQRTCSLRNKLKHLFGVFSRLYGE